LFLNNYFYCPYWDWRRNRPNPYLPMKLAPFINSVFHRPETQKIMLAKPLGGCFEKAAQVSPLTVIPV